MKIRIYDIHNQPKTLLQNTNSFQAYNDLQYSHSLTGIGDCTFTLMPQQITKLRTGDKFPRYEQNLNGLEYVYLEEDGKIVWAGIIVEVNSDINNTVVRCLEMKHALTLIKLDAPFAISGTAGDSIEALLNEYKENRDIPMTISEKTEVVEQVKMTFTIGKDIYSCIKAIIDGTSARWRIEYFIDGTEITTKLVARSIVGVSPEGVGIDRNISSTETDEPVFLIYDHFAPNRTNIMSVSGKYDLRGLVTENIVSTKLPTGNKIFKSLQDNIEDYPIGSYERTALQYLEQLSFIFGKVHTFTNNVEVKDDVTGQRVADAGVSFPTYKPEFALPPEAEDRLQVGDRFSAYVYSPNITIIQVAGDGTYYNIPTGLRVEEKKVDYSNGYRQIQITASIGLSPNNYKTLLQQIANGQRESQPIQSSYTAD